MDAAFEVPSNNLFGSFAGTVPLSWNTVPTTTLHSAPYLSRTCTGFLESEKALLAASVLSYVKKVENSSESVEPFVNSIEFALKPVGAAQTPTSKVLIFVSQEHLWDVVD